MYKLKEDRFEHPAGTVVCKCKCKGHDYGCSNDDARFTGMDHISVTLDPMGDYPFFTVPTHQLIKTTPKGINL